MALQFIISQKGSRQLVHNGFVFNYKYPNKDGTHHWKCACSYKSKCNAKVDTDTKKKSGKVIKTTDSHNHILEKSELKSIKVKSAIKKKASKSAESTMNIVATSTSNVSKNTSFLLPLNKSLCRTVQRERRKVLGGHTFPEDASELIIPEMYKNTIRGEKFLYSDDYVGEDRILLFTTELNLRILKKCKIWQCDGTFDTVPLIFKQLYCIHGRKDDKLFPLVYVLCKRKSKETYEFILNKLRELKRNLNPTSIIVDFELAFIIKFQEIFPETEIHGCLYHFSQSVWRHIQECGLQKKYQDDENVSFEIRKLLALTFVPPQDVIHHYDVLINSEYYIDNKEVFKPVLEYFEPTWIRKKGKRRTKPPTYPIELWNCYQSVLNNDPRTNNDVEGWHRGFSDKLNESHASIPKFLNAIQREQSLMENKYSDMLGGKTQETRKRRVVEGNSRLYDVVSKYENDASHDELEYLEGVAMNVYFSNVNKSKKSRRNEC